MENAKRSPSTSVSDELRAAREAAREKQARAAQAIKEAEEAMAEIARLSGVEPTKRSRRGEKSPSPSHGGDASQTPAKKQVSFSCDTEQEQTRTRLITIEEKMDADTDELLDVVVMKAPEMSTIVGKIKNGELEDVEERCLCCDQEYPKRELLVLRPKEHDWMSSPVAMCFYCLQVSKFGCHRCMEDKQGTHPRFSYTYGQHDVDLGTAIEREQEDRLPTAIAPFRSRLLDQNENYEAKVLWKDDKRIPFWEDTNEGWKVFPNLANRSWKQKAAFKAKTYVENVRSFQYSDTMHDLRLMTGMSKAAARRIHLAKAAWWAAVIINTTKNRAAEECESILLLLNEWHDEKKESILKVPRQWEEGDFHDMFGDWVDTITEGVDEYYVCRDLSCRTFTPSCQWLCTKSASEGWGGHYKCPSCLLRYQPWVESKRGEKLLPAQKVMVLDKGGLKSAALAEMGFTPEEIAEVSGDFDDATSVGTAIERENTDGDGSAGKSKDGKKKFWLMMMEETDEKNLKDKLKKKYWESFIAQQREISKMKPWTALEASNALAERHAREAVFEKAEFPIARQQELLAGQEFAKEANTFSFAHLPHEGNSYYYNVCHYEYVEGVTAILDQKDHMRLWSMMRFAMAAVVESAKDKKQGRLGTASERGQSTATSSSSSSSSSSSGRVQS